MNLLTEAEIRVLRTAGFTLREITTQQRKFHNLLRVSPWPVEDLQRRECSAPGSQWVGLTEREIDEAYLKETDMSLDIPWIFQFGRSLEAKLKEKNT